ncbi:MAG TPA: protein kinase [Gaiellaceae bacterium]|nr:protein kinase [Gaiellaceae bacterium]
MTQQVVRTVGRYEILRELGRGGMAAVYLARQIDLDRHVALKELGAFHASDPAFAERFLRESQLAGSLSHPNIVTVHEYFEHEGTPFIAMEYLPRGSMRPLMSELSLAQVAGVMEGLLAGLTHAASHGIVHRDLKPENLMITAEGRIKIADFGIAKALNQAANNQFLTATGTTVGTPAYMAPEQAMAKDIGPWTDLYSTGAIAYELLVGNVPYHDTTTPMAILLRHVNDPVPRPRKAKPDLDVRLADWVESLLEKAPEDRPPSAEAAWETFEEAVIQILGPRWRRDARLNAPTTVVNTPEPLTPAPFHEPSAQFEQAPEAAAFVTFQRGTPAPASETPPPLPEPLPVEPIAPTDAPADDPALAPPVAAAAAAAAADSTPLAPAPEYLTFAPERAAPAAPPDAEPPTAPPAVEATPAAVEEPAAQPPLEPVGAVTAAPASVSAREPVEPTPGGAVEEPRAVEEPLPAEPAEPKRPSGATSFQWPSVEKGGALRSRRTWVIAGGAVAIAAIAGGLAVVMGGGGSGGGAATPTTPAVVTSLPTAAERLGVAAGAPGIFVSSPAGRLISVAPKARTVSDPVSPRAVAVAGPTVFVADKSGVVPFNSQLEPRTPVSLQGVQALAPAGGGVAAVAKTGGGGRVCLVSAAGASTCATVASTPTAVGVVGPRIYVAGSGGTVTPYLVRKNRLVAQAPMRAGRSPRAVVAFRGRLYVAVSDGVAVLDLIHRKVKPLRTIRFGATPAAITVVPSSGHLFAALYGKNAIAMVNTVGGNAAPQTTASVMRPVALAADGAAVYALSAQDHSLSTLDTLTGKLRKRTPIAALRLGPVVPTKLTKIGFSSSGRLVTVKLAFGGGGFDGRGFTARDTNISDGRAAFAVSQRGIGSAVSTADGKGVSVSVARGNGLLGVHLKTANGAFTALKPTVGHTGKSITIALTKKPKTVVHTTTTSHTTTTPQQTTTQPSVTHTKPSCVNHRRIVGYIRGRPVYATC